MNQYHPKSHTEKTSTQKSHIYSIRGTLNQGIFTVFVYDQMNKNEFEQKFTQANFPNMKLYDIAKAVVDAIKSTMQGGPPQIKCQEWNGMAFVTVVGGHIPTLALPPKGADEQQIMQMQQQAQQAAHEANMKSMNSMNSMNHSMNSMNHSQGAYQAQMDMNGGAHSGQQLGALTAANLQNLNDQQQHQHQHQQQMGWDNVGNGGYDDMNGIPQSGAYDNFQQQLQQNSEAKQDVEQSGNGGYANNGGHALNGVNGINGVNASNMNAQYGQQHGVNGVNGVNGGYGNMNVNPQNGGFEAQNNPNVQSVDNHVNGVYGGNPQSFNQRQMDYGSSVNLQNGPNHGPNGGGYGQNGYPQNGYAHNGPNGPQGSPQNGYGQMNGFGDQQQMGFDQNAVNGVNGQYDGNQVNGPPMNGFGGGGGGGNNGSGGGGGGGYGHQDMQQNGMMSGQQQGSYVPMGFGNQMM